MKKNIFKNKKAEKAIVGLLSVALVAEVGTAVAYIDVKAEETDSAATTVSAEPSQEMYDLFKDYLAEDNTNVPTKNETVYVIANADGSPANVIVSDWVSNPQHADTLVDVSALSNIENVKDDRAYTTADGGIIWDAKGADIYYRGTSTEELPITLTVSYFLDGKEILPQDLAGKSGNVKIRFDYTNNSSTMAEINGNEETIYVPFAALTGMILDNEHFHNVEISNGKLINDGNRTIVIGFALPGLTDSLQIDNQAISIPSYVEVTAETVDFSLLTTMTLATPSLLNKVNLDNVGNLSELQSKLDELDAASTQLVDGTAAIYENLELIVSKSSELVSGVDTATNGSALLADAGQTLSAGITNAHGGAMQLQDGLNQLTAKSAALVDGAATVYNSLLQSASAQISAAGLTLQGPMTIGEYGATINNTIAYYSSQEVFAGMLIMAYNNNIVPTYSTPVANDYSEYTTYIALVNAAAGTDVDATLRASVSNTINTQILPALKGAKTSLDQYGSFYQGVIAYTKGVDAVATGMTSLVAGLNQLDEGAATMSTKLIELNKGLLAIKSGTHTLVDGLGQLRDGASTLNAGMNQFYTDGISKLLNVVDLDSIGTLLQRLQAISKAGQAYTSFSGIDENMPGSVKFLIETSSIQ